MFTKARTKNTRNILKKWAFQKTKKDISKKYKKSSAEEAENYKKVAVPACCLPGLFFVFIEICRIFLPLPMGEVPRRGGEGKLQLSHTAEQENNTKTERDTGNLKKRLDIYQNKY